MPLVEEIIGKAPELRCVYRDNNEKHSVFCGTCTIIDDYQERYLRTKALISTAFNHCSKNLHESYRFRTTHGLWPNQAEGYRNALEDFQRFVENV